MPPSIDSTASTSTYLPGVHNAQATLIQFINGNKLKSCRTAAGLTNHTRSISHHITLLLITALGDGHTDTYQHTNKNDFKKPGAHGFGRERLA